MTLYRKEADVQLWSHDPFFSVHLVVDHITLLSPLEGRFHRRIAYTRCPDDGVCYKRCTKDASRTRRRVYQLRVNRPVIMFPLVTVFQLKRATQHVQSDNRMQRTVQQENNKKLYSWTCDVLLLVCSSSVRAIHQRSPIAYSHPNGRRLFLLTCYAEFIFLPLLLLLVLFLLLLLLSLFLFLSFPFL